MSENYHCQYNDYYASPENATYCGTLFRHCFFKALLPAPNVQELQFDPQNHKPVCKMINVELFYLAFCFCDLGHICKLYTLTIRTRN